MRWPRGGSEPGRALCPQREEKDRVSEAKERDVGGAAVFKQEVI